MANANTNLISTANRSTTPIKPTSRTQPSARSRTADTKSYASHGKYDASRSSKKNNFSSELDKANAQANQTQPSDDAKIAAASAESESVNEIAKTSSQGKNNEKQDAPQKELQNPSGEKTTQSVDQNVAGNVVTEIISSHTTSQPSSENDADVQQNLLQNFEVEIIDENIPQQVTPTISVNPAQNTFDKSTKNLNATIPSNVPVENLDSDVADKNLNIAENVPSQAMSADMAFYFVASNENLLAVKDIPAEVDTENLMSIMPQTRNNKAQSMLDFLSGKTWQSVSTETDTPQNLNLQNLFPQSEQTANVPPVQIQPQYQPRVIDIQSSMQATQTDFQPLVNQPTLQTQQQTDFQPLMNQPTLQTQQQTDFQPIMNQPTLQTQQQTDFQPFMNQQNLQPQQQTGFQPIMNQQNLQPQQQTDFQPIMNQQNLQPQQQTGFQPVTNQQDFQSQQQSDFQPFMNQQNLQPQQQSDFQPITSQQNLQTQQQIDFQPIMNQQNFQSQQQSNFQPTLNQNQSTLQAQTQPQVQQQQFGGEIQPQVNSLQPQIEPKIVNRQVVDDMLGVNLQVEDNQQTTPLMPLQNMSRQFNQNQQSMQNFQQSFAPMTAEVKTQIAENAPAGAENFAGNIAALNTTQNQATAQVQSPEAMQAPREDFNVPAQIVEQARMIRTATNTEMVINLKPEHLGELTLRVSVGTNGAVTASFYSDNAQVRAIIENSIVNLKQELNDQGIKVDDVEVYAGLNEDSLLNGQGQQAWQQNQQQRSHRGFIDFEAAEKEIDELTPVTENLSADGVDYKV